MTIPLFEQFKDQLALAIQDVDFVAKNTLFQDEAYRQTILDRIEALTSDVTLEQDYGDVYSTLGLLTRDVPSRTVRFEPKGFETTLSAYREGTIAKPRRLWARSGTDDVRYLLSDGGGGALGNGVFLLNQDLEILRRLPGYGTDVAGGDYEDAAAAISFTIQGTEYVAVACQSREVVQIYLYDAPYTNVATIGTLDTPGAAANLLTNPNGIAVDETNEIMYISCPTGQPAGATASNGFVAAYDISVVATPAYSAIDLFYAGTGSLLDAQVHTPVDVMFDSGQLWVVNENDSTVGAFTFGLTGPVCTRFIEAAGAGYTLRTPSQVYARTLLGGFERLYVANSGTGTIEEFDGRTFRHLATYGIRANEDNVGSYTRLSPVVFGAIGQPQGVVADMVYVDGQQTNVLIVTDDLNNRIERFNLDAYTTDNFANFNPITLSVPVIVDGWSVSGTVPLDLVTMQYRFNETEQFRDLPRDTSLAPSTKLQFRVSVRLDHYRFIRSDWRIDKIRIHGRQA